MLTAGARGPEDLHPDVGLVDLDVGLVEFGPHLHGRETRLAAALVVERTDADEAVRATLARHQPVGVPPLERELGRVDTGFDTLGLVVERDLEAALLGPAGVHAQQHLGEVLRVDAAVLGVDLHDARRIVVLAGEQAAELELVERGS